MEKGLSNELENFKQQVAEKAREVVYQIFPTKVLELNRLISSTSECEPFQSTNSLIIGSELNEPKFKKRKLEEEEIKRSTHGVPLQQIVKKEAEELIMNIDNVKLWVTLNMPRIEDGNNFGIQVQEDIVNELNRAQDSAYNLRDFVFQDTLARAKIGSKIVKYPTVEYYPRALTEHEEKQKYVARRYIVELRGLYALLTDLIHKNVDKVLRPKGNNRIALY